MKWFQIAQMLLPALGMVVPGAAPIILIISKGIHDAQAIHGDSNNAAKRALVKEAVDTAVATGKVKIDAVKADQITNAVFESIDNIQAIVKANQ